MLEIKKAPQTSTSWPLTEETFRVIYMIGHADTLNNKCQNQNDFAMTVVGHHSFMSQ